MPVKEEVRNAHEVVDAVRESIAATPPFEGISLTVDEKGVIATDVGGQTWWARPGYPFAVPALFVSAF